MKKTYTRKIHMKPSVVKQLFTACINFKTDTCQPGTKDCLSNITGEIPKFQKFAEEHQQFTISLVETQLPIHTGKVENPNLFHRGLIL